eukprot:6177023-Pleurochrysis_carterae.AAC.5
MFIMCRALSCAEEAGDRVWVSLFRSVFPERRCCISLTSMRHLAHVNVAPRRLPSCCSSVSSLHINIVISASVLESHLVMSAQLTSH